jgi:hypothetical protein
MRLKFKLFLFLVTIQLGCAGVPLFARPNCPAKASRNAATEIRGHGDGVPQFWRKFGDPLLNRLIAQAISSSKDPAILAFRIRQARVMHELSRFPSTSNPTHIAELEFITARREGVRSNLPEGELFDPGFDSLWEMNFSFLCYLNRSMCALLNNYCAAGRTSPPSKGVWWAPHPEPAFLSKICFQE